MKFIDENGEESPKVPTAAGAYQVVLEAVDGGKYKGSLKTRISLQDEKKLTIDLASRPSGIYYLRVHSAAGVTIQKFVKL